MYLSLPLGVGVDSLVFIHLIPSIDHKIRMVINRLNHHMYPSSTLPIVDIIDPFTDGLLERIEEYQ